MNKIIKPLCLALSACLLLFSSSACANKDDGVETIQVNEVTHSIFYAPLYLADSLGYFAEENIKIELTMDIISTEGLWLQMAVGM